MVEDRPLGTAGAIKAAQSQVGDEEFVMVNGDIMTDMDLSPMFSSWGEFVAKIALVPMVSPYGVVKTFNDKVTGFIEKPLLKDVWVNAGLYWLSPRYLASSQTRVVWRRTSFQSWQRQEVWVSSDSRYMTGSGDPLTL